LRERGAHTQVIMSAGAQAFVTPLTLQAVSGHAVHCALLEAQTESAFSHIDLARWADLILVAPASAHTLAKLAHGLADDLLTTVCLASTAPQAVAPAMNQYMWAASATQANMEILRKRGVHIYGPAHGAQACGENGAGRMLESMELVSALETFFSHGSLCGVRVLVNAGPTREDLDPVRFISNRSSGRMGYAVAQAALSAGAHVTLISGPVCLPVPAGVDFISVYSAADMYQAVLAAVPTQDIFIATAAVADYRPIQLMTHKIKKSSATLDLTLEPTIDILAHLAQQAHSLFVVGFAAETHDVSTYARDKLVRKKLDMIAANHVGLPGQGFDSEENALHVLWDEGECILPRSAKSLIAQQLIALIATRFQAKMARLNNRNAVLSSPAA
jgi:phosphopantothenoylcysteine decarboxylase / phosphopantothenate---cysteine ligase